MSNDETKSSEGSFRPEYKTYGDIVWEQFKKYTLSYYSMWGVVCLFLLATIAPMIALNVPFYIYVPASAVVDNVAAGVHFPWAASLFDQGFFESGVDIFFNSMIFTAPTAVITWFFASKSAAKRLNKQEMKGFRVRYALSAAAAIMVVFLLFYFGGFRQPPVNWVQIAGQDGVSSIFPPVEYSYRLTDTLAVAKPPTWAHLLGTDDRGRDVFTRMIYGTRISLTIGILAVAIYTTIGMILGGIAGFFGGRVDALVLRLVEVMICFPTFFLILTLRGFVTKASVFHIMLIIGLTGWTGIARLVRGEFLRLKGQDFVQAAIAMGFDKRRIIFRHLMPNAMGPVLVSATFGVAGAIILEASLSFLGLGPTTAPSWGQIMTVGRRLHAWTLILAPGFAIFVTVSLLNLVGEGFRDALDPKLRK